MNPEEIRRKMMLLAKDYPIRIKTAGGKYLIPLITFQKDKYGMPINHRETFAEFDNLADAIEAGIKWKESRYS